MRRFRVIVETDTSGSECETVVELPDDASDADIEKETREAAMDMISWIGRRSNDKRLFIKK